MSPQPPQKSELNFTKRIKIQSQRYIVISHTMSMCFFLYNVLCPAAGVCFIVHLYVRGTNRQVHENVV